MLKLSLASIAEATQGHAYGADVGVECVSTDSRKHAANALFVALRGEQHDAHEFLAQARGNGAVAALVERRIDTDLAQVVVVDTQIALGRLAAHVRSQRDVCVIGITGSNGKTTVKTLLAGILARVAPTHASIGSFNNEIGLPLTLLSMPEDTRFAVLEMGAGKPGDIDYLAAIAQPQIALVNNVAPAHLERMGSLDGVAATKGAIYSALPVDGIAVINADDAYAGFFAGLAGSRRVIRFGVNMQAEVMARFDKAAPANAFTLLAAGEEIDIALPLLGRHNVNNALAAASLALAVDVPLAAIRQGLEAASAVAGRSAQRMHASGALIIDDTYNANPASFAAAIDTLAAFSGTRILVVGDMRELGADGETLHARIGTLAAAKGIERLLAVGALSRATATAFGSKARHFPDQAALIEVLRDELSTATTVLIKGSRGSAMDRVVAALFAAEATPGGRHAA
ncbi:MAG TPA: UDP-N-acetylmuramoyl-tripeptide--D-alanyl-D-alanine ligase [Dokdonella sp.]|nr:UDP-N-acetylmuramoyl-tripeptide--D-alanyl-D-alanine ligase [Dokdonella sp.]